jgi:hypothetical protein
MTLKTKFSTDIFNYDSNRFFLKISALVLLQLDALEQGLKISGAESLMSTLETFFSSSLKLRAKCSITGKSF